MAEGFTWSLQGLNKHHFIAFGNLLALRNDGQIEPASSHEEPLLEDQQDDDSDSGSIDTRQPRQISESGHDAMKRKFLDCLAEFAANKRGGQSVACSAMKESEESVNIWVTRNGGFKELEKPVFNQLANDLSKLSCSGEPEYLLAENSLWDLMIDYQYDRLEKTFIPNLRSAFKECVNLFDAPIQDPECTFQELSSLRTLVFDICSPDQKLADRHKALVIKAFELWTTKNVQKLLKTPPYVTSKTEKLRKSIYFLARIRIALWTFSNIVKKLPSFNSVTIHLVDQGTKIQNALEGPLKLKEVFNLLKLPLDESTIKAVVGQKWTVMKAEKEFANKQKQKLNIHAEIQMVLFLSRDKGYFPYFGCSKYSCFMCFHFLKAYGTINTRGCHGRLFNPWTVPEATSLTAGQAERITQAVVQLQRDAKKELKSELVSHLKREKTSAVGGSSIFNEAGAGIQRRKREIQQLQMKVVQENVAGRFERLVLEEQDASASQHQNLRDHSVNRNSYPNRCIACLEETSRKCSVCHKGWYCSNACEEKRTIPHIFQCSKRPITSADYLYMDCSNDRMPDDPDVLRDFGFDALEGFTNKTQLLGLYQGLRILGVPVEDIHRWRVEGSLVANIKQVYSRVPIDRRGGYFPWFLNHTNIFDPPKIGVERKMFSSTSLDAARTYLDEEDQNIDLKDFKPLAKARAHLLLLEALELSLPDPPEYNWINFGFCTCGGQGTETALSYLYHKLVLGPHPRAPTDHKEYARNHESEKTSFREFWQAHEAGSLIQLIDSKGYKEERLEFPFLEDVLSVPIDGPQLSVWYLKQFIETNDPAEFPPTGPIYSDYGFMNCRAFEETCILMEIYKRLLSKASPLDLHAACLQGKLFEFAQMFHTMDEDYRRLMKNHYPLETN